MNITEEQLKELFKQSEQLAMSEFVKQLFDCFETALNKANVPFSQQLVVMQNVASEVAKMKLEKTQTAA